MAQNDLYGVRFQFRDHGSIWTVNLAFRDETGVDEKDASNDLGVIANTTLGPLFDDARAQDSTREGSYCWKINAGTGMPDKQSDASIPGDVLFASTPPNMCAVISLRTTDPAAARFGRIYIGGNPKTTVEDGRWTAAQVTKLQTLGAAIVAPLVGAIGTWQSVILRRVSGGVPIVPPEGSTISSSSVSNIVYSQRRRNSRQIGTG